MKLTIVLVVILVVVATLAAMQMRRADYLESRLVEVDRVAKAQDGACTHLAQEVRSAIRMPNDNQMSVSDDGAITIIHKPTFERWVFPPSGNKFEIHTPTR